MGRTLFKFTTVGQIGDHVICTGAVHNICCEYQDVLFARTDMHPCVWDNNPHVVEPLPDDRVIQLPQVEYGPYTDEQVAKHGTVVEGFTKTLSRYLGLPLSRVAVNHPVLYLSDQEIEQSRKWAGKWVLNANCQTCSMSKGYPHWQAVVDRLTSHGIQFVQIGGNEARDVSPTIRGVEDMRGKTTFRELIVMVYGADGVLSPPSGVSNIAGAFSRKQVIVNASREPDAMLAYDNAVHVSHKCSCGWGVDNGCIHLFVNRTYRRCPHLVNIHGMPFSKCQVETDPDSVVAAVLRLV